MSGNPSKLYAVFAPNPPKNGVEQYKVMEITENDKSTKAIESAIADAINNDINNNRLENIRAGVTNYMTFIAPDAKTAFNTARQSGLKYKTKDEILREKAASANQEKFKTAAKAEQNTRTEKTASDIEKVFDAIDNAISAVADLFSPRKK